MKFKPLFYPYFEGTATFADMDSHSSRKGICQHVYSQDLDAIQQLAEVLADHKIKVLADREMTIKTTKILLATLRLISTKYNEKLSDVFYDIYDAFDSSPEGKRKTFTLGLYDKDRVSLNHISALLINAKRRALNARIILVALRTVYQSPHLYKDFINSYREVEKDTMPGPRN